MANNATEKIGFHHLGPEDIEVSTAHKEMFDIVFKSEKVFNCAVIGSYGSGKTSLINSYKKKYVNNQEIWLHIALADFTNDSGVNLQSEIISQLLLQVRPENIPKIKYKITQKSWIKVVSLGLIMIIFIFTSYFTLNFQGWTDSIINNPLLQWTLEPGMRLIFLLISIVGAMFIAYNIFNRNYLWFMKKMSIGTITLEAQESSEKYFSKYQEELCYIIQKHQTEVIVFEDLDRFKPEKTLEILQELRHFNQVLNRHPHIQQTVRFLYVIKDDLFQSGKERAKFFEFIIPVLPFLSAHNAEELLLSEFKNAFPASRENSEQPILETKNKQKIVSLRYIREISRYIDDMRILHNSMNEFKVYDHIQKQRNLNYEKLYALILLKSLYPPVFCELQSQSGELSQLARISPNSLKELYVDKASEYRKKKHPIHNKQGADAESQQVMNDRMATERWSRNTTLQKLEQLEITEKDPAGIFTTIEKQWTNALKKEANSAYKFVRYLLFNDLLDHTYQDYINYFHEGSLMVEDEIFLRSIQEYKSLPWEYELKNPIQILNRLYDNDFQRQEILNYDLFSTIIVKRKTVAVMEIMKHLKQAEITDFITKYFTEKNSEKTEQQFFFEQLNTHWLEFFEAAKFKTEDWKIYFVKSIITYLSPKDMDEITDQRQNYDKLLSYISEFAVTFDDFPHWLEANYENLQILGVKFQDIATVNLDEVTLSLIASQNLYKITNDNIYVLLQSNNLKDVSKQDFNQAIYTFVQLHGTEEMSQYIEDNFELFIEEVLESCNHKITDLEQYAIEVLEECSDNRAGTYIEYLDTLIDGVQPNTLSKSVLNMLITAKKIKLTVANMYTIYVANQEKITAELIEFINQSAYDSYFEIEGYKEKTQFLSQLFSNNQIADNRYGSLVSAAVRLGIKFQFNHNNILTFTRGKQAEIIYAGWLQITREIVAKYYASDKELWLAVVENYPAEVSGYTSSVTNRDMEMIFNSSLDVEMKKTYRSKCNEILTFKNEYSDQDKELILEQYLHFDQTNSYNIDYNQLFEFYSEQTPTIQIMIENLAVYNSTDLIALETKNIPIAIMQKILVDNELTDLEKIDLFCLQQNQINRETAILYLGYLNPELAEALKNVVRKKPIVKNEENTRLLEVLEVKNWITKSESNGKYYIYTKKHG